MCRGTQDFDEKEEGRLRQLNLRQRDRRVDKEELQIDTQDASFLAREGRGCSGDRGKPSRDDLKGFKKDLSMLP